MVLVASLEPFHQQGLGSCSGLRARWMEMNSAKATMKCFKTENLNVLEWSCVQIWLRVYGTKIAVHHQTIQFDFAKRNGLKLSGSRHTNMTETYPRRLAALIEAKSTSSLTFIKVSQICFFSLRAHVGLHAKCKNHSTEVKHDGSWCVTATLGSWKKHTVLAKKKKKARGGLQLWNMLESRGHSSIPDDDCCYCCILEQGP